jgi:ABC-type Zn uptake system ZnuABC Zn-binding protein ZnuA
VRRVAAAAVALLAASLAGCAGGGGGGAPPAPVRIAVTIAPLTSIVANIAGPDAEVVGLIPEGVDATSFVPDQGTERTLAAADVVFANGLGLESSTLALAGRATADDVDVIELGAVVADEDAWRFERTFPDQVDDPNPHLWLWPAFAKRYAEEVRDVLVEVHPDGRDIYQSNYEQYAGRLDDLDEAIRAATATVAADDLQLLTYHDAYPYLAGEYGWTLLDPIQPADLAQPTDAQVTAAAAAAAAADVRAVFGSVEFPSPAVQRVAEAGGATDGADLRDEDLPGAPGDPSHSYLGMVQGDLIAIVEALGGDPAALRTTSVTDVVEDRATYPQAG